MHRPSTVLLAATVILLAAPHIASAHEHRVFEIGDKRYSIVVGWLSEPVHVDDKTGVEVIVSDLSAPAKTATSDDGDGDDDGPAGTPVTGLQKDLQVEISAGDQKKTFGLEPEAGKDGSYQAVFYPTVQTTYAYRVFGTLNGIPIDVTYTCNPAATEDAPEDTAPVKISDSVTQTQKGGAFGCPTAKTDVEFPLPGAPIADLNSRVTVLENSKGGTDTGTAGIIAGLIGILIGAGAWMKAGKR